MKQFDLQEYLKNPSQKVVTRDGRDVKIVCTDVKNDFSIIALVCCKDNKEDVRTYHKNGCTLNGYESPNDLFFASKKKDKFDPNTLQPFDRVLVRNFKSNIWKCDHVSYFREEYDYPCVCSSDSYSFCVPYNDETKYLVGTSNEAPEYYKYWEE